MIEVSECGDIEEVRRGVGSESPDNLGWGGLHLRLRRQDSLKPPHENSWFLASHVQVGDESTPLGTDVEQQPQNAISEDAGIVGARLLGSRRDVPLKLRLTISPHGLVAQVLLDLDRQLPDFNIDTSARAVRGRRLHVRLVGADVQLADGQ